jgi:phosphopantetheinyl transferase (holo-ACP synthase)
MKMNVCIKGVGCDTVSIPRFEEKMNNTRLADKLFTEYEQNYIADKQIP